VCALAAEPGKGRTAPSEAQRLVDSATELEVVRLTSAEHTALMTSPSLRSISRKQGFFLYSSDRSGTMQAWRMDLKTGESRQLTDAEELDPESLALSPDERSFYYFDGKSLRHAFFNGLHSSELYRLDEDINRNGTYTLSDDGLFAAFGIETGGDSRLFLVNLVRRTTATVTAQHFGIFDPLFRPRHAQLLYRGENSIWLTDFTGRSNRQLKTAEGGELGPARWSPTGQSVFYLHYPGEHELNALREWMPDEKTDKLVSKTSQFVQFGINGDATVFVGASRNQGSPYVLLLLRVTRRELTLCEHRASEPAEVKPVFSPDSQRIFFQSDHEGKPAIYRIRVEKFVEETDG